LTGREKEILRGGEAERRRYNEKGRLRGELERKGGLEKEILREGEAERRRY